MSNYSEARKNANKNWDSKNLDRISVALPKGSKDALKAHAESTGETVNAFIKRAIMEVTEMDNMHRAYQRGLLRQLEKVTDALDGGDGERAKRLIAELIEDAKADIGD
nr:MAG TPA: Alginate and motility regulator [Caudoviricetes sp.]